MSEVVFIGLPAPLIAAAVADLPAWPVLGERMLQVSKDKCPVGKNEDGSDSGALKESMELRLEYGLDPRIMIGSTRTLGDSGVSALGVVEYDTDPHPIDPVNAQALRFTSGGTVVFAAHVDHPGTKAQPFVEESIRAVILESADAL
jgi:hypothetical protein